MKRLLATLIALFIFSPAVICQHEQQIAETESTVPELNAFHKTVYPMWHKAYPDKDYTLFKKLLPDINAGAEKIYSAELPGILRDKKDNWNKGIANLRASVEAYNKAITDNDEPGILKSAETLHSNYEMLVRIIRPVTKEVDEYHKVLYMIYHHYLPEKSSELGKAIDDLAMRADSLQKAVLPKWAAAKSDEFKKLSDDLYNSTKELQGLKDKDYETVHAAVDNVHAKYQKLEALFD